MLSRWLAARKSLVATVTSGSLVTALVVTIAVASGGYTAQRLDLNDASVWVSNASEQAIGRANTEVFELNSVVAAASAELEVIQRGATVLLFDRGSNKVDIVDAATSQITDSVAMPPNRPEVYLAGSQVVILEGGTGELWVVPLVDLATFDAQEPSTLSFGQDAVGEVDDAGHFVAFSPTARKVYRLDPGRNDIVENAQSVDFVSPSGQYSVTSVGTTWAVLDAASRELQLPGATVDLSPWVDAADTAVLQSATATGDQLFVGVPDGLLAVPLQGGAPQLVVDGRSGVAVAPLVAGGCAFAAWADGTAWRSCAGGSADTLELAGIRADASLAFARNGERVLLNDARGGASWAVQRHGEVIDNWADLIVVNEDEQQQQENDLDTPPEVEKVQVAPIAIDDQFGARPGRATILPVLLNDYDPNGDVIVISETTAIDEGVGRLDFVTERQQLQLTLASTATGQLTFRYTVTDGRGGIAAASVTVTVRSASENSAPTQVRSTKTSVEEGGRVSMQVLGDWVDPDGDTIFLSSASTADPDSVSYKPEGTVVFVDSGDQPTSVKAVALVVSDGVLAGNGNLSITVRPTGDVPIIADPFVVLAYSGQEVTVNPLDHVRGGSGALRLASVPSKAGVTVVPSYESASFRFVSTEVRTHYLEYTVSDGQQTATGIVRVDVASPPDANTKPITVPKTVFVQTLRNARVDVAGTDIDPAGGVLLVTGVMNLASDSGVRAEVLEQRIVRVSLDAPLDGGPVSFNYRISNGLAEAEGVITVVEIPTPPRIQPPIATDDDVTVRVGAAIDIPVLANDEQPDGEDITLDPVLAEDLPADGGLLFASGNSLRYLAPDRTGNFSAVYQIAGPDGQTARGQVNIKVREADLATNSAPVPHSVTARVLAGETVRIEIPLSGVDPDGDTVQLLGLETSPEKGSVTEVGPNYFAYAAGEYSAGTDMFSYTVIDALGARATGLVRVGISARLDGTRNPVATVDEVTVRPGVTVSVQVLANDSDPDGSPLRVVSVQPSDELTTADVIDDVVRITPPVEPGRYGLIYTIENQLGGSSSNFIRVVVDPEAPLAYPVVRDSVLTLSDVLDRTSIDVNVLANVFFADGDPGRLGVSIYRGYGEGAQVTESKRVRVTIRNKSQIIPFKVTHPDDATVFSSAFIWVPGFDDALPQLNRNSRPIEVKSGDTVTINLNDYVLAIGGKTVRLTDSATVRATHSDGSDIVVDPTTLRFTSADKYFGPASIAFEVTDGASASDPDGRKANLVLPITVTPRANQPPVFTGATLDFEPGQEKTLDLVKLTNYPYDNDLDELVYTILDPQPVSFSYTLIGQRLTIRADPNAVRGSSTALTLGVRDSLADGKAGRIQLGIVPSTRPLTRPAADIAVTKRGATTVVDVLANDEATNPFPETPLRVIAIRGIDGGSLPAGVSVSPSPDNSRLTVSVSQSALPGDANFQYQVADGTGEPGRFVWGTVKISVQDRPEPVSNVHVTEFADRRLVVAWNNGGFNNAPITGFTVLLTRADTGETVSTTSCSGSLCSVATAGNGPAFAVRIAVVAINAIGASDPAMNAGPIWSDVIPAPPTALGSAPADQGLRIGWNKPGDAGAGTPITRYVVTIDGGPSRTVTVSPTDPVGTRYSVSISDPRMTNGSAVGYSVSARNDSFNSLATWNSASAVGYPAGPPVRAGSTSASGSLEDGSTASFSWAGAFTDNGRAISAYYAAAYTDTAPTCSPVGELPSDTVAIDSAGAQVRNAGTATSTTFTGLTANTTYSFVVFAFNGMGCTDSAVVQATPRARPGTVSKVTVTSPEPSGDGTWDVRMTGFTIGSGSNDADSFIYRLGGTGVDGSEYGPVAPGSLLTTSNGSHYGTKNSVSVKACRNYPEGMLCSANWSTAFAIGTPVYNSPLGGLVFSRAVVDPATEPDTGRYTWSSSPVGSYTSMSYSCDDGETTTSLASGSSGSCDVTETIGAPRAFPSLTITIQANGTTYSRSYAWEDYD